MVISLIVVRLSLSNVNFLAKGAKLAKLWEECSEGRLYRDRLKHFLSVVETARFASGSVKFSQGVLASVIRLNSGRIRGLTQVFCFFPSVKTVSEFVGDAVGAAKFFGVTPAWGEPVSKIADVVYYVMDVNDFNISSQSSRLNKLVDVTKVICSLVVAVFKAIEFFYAVNIVAPATVTVIALTGAVASFSAAYFENRKIVLKALS